MPVRSKCTCSSQRLGQVDGQTDVLLTARSAQLLATRRGRARRAAILSSFSYLESPEAFVVGRLTHITSTRRRSLPVQPRAVVVRQSHARTVRQILNRMGCHFCQRGRLRGRQLAGTFRRSPAAPEKSERFAPSTCRASMPCRLSSHPERAQSAEVAHRNLQNAYNRVHGDYDTFCSPRAQPVDDLIAQIPWTGRERVFEAGCRHRLCDALLAGASPRAGGRSFRRHDRGARARVAGATCTSGFPRRRWLAGADGRPFDAFFSSCARYFRCARFSPASGR